MKSRRSNVLAAAPSACGAHYNGENCCGRVLYVWPGRVGDLFLLPRLKLFSPLAQRRKERGRHINSPGLGQLYRLIFDGEIAHIAARGLVGGKSFLANDPVWKVRAGSEMILSYKPCFSHRNVIWSRFTFCGISMHAPNPSERIKFVLYVWEMLWVKWQCGNFSWKCLLSIPNDQTLALWYNIFAFLDSIKNTH